MQIRILPATVLAGLLISQGSAHAGLEKITRLQCVWDTIQDTKTGTIDQASGIQLFVYRPTGGTYGQLDVEGAESAFFNATVTDVYLQAQAKYKLGNLLVTERIEVNRFTGAIRKWRASSEKGAMYEGRCTPVVVPLF